MRSRQPTRTTAETHVELALKFLEEGKGLVDKDPIQASEKLYKAAEETVKALAIHFNLVNIIKSVNERGRWTVTDLERVPWKSQGSWEGGSGPLGMRQTTYTCGDSMGLKSTLRISMIGCRT